MAKTQPYSESAIKPEQLAKKLHKAADLILCHTGTTVWGTPFTLHK